ncbi:MAG: hypothetical protein AAGC60_09435 [Acidobacteriota bacterium]
MNRPLLPFDILGQVSPLLSWVEGTGGGRLPVAWQAGPRPVKEREQGWLLDELPTYSYDNVEEIVSGSRALHRLGHRRPSRMPADPRWPYRLDPPADYDLLQAFRYLNEYFLVWNGTEPCVREGRMEDFHELGIRLPASHIVRHGHARTVSEGVISFRDALDLPEQITLLPSNSFGLRSVVRRGLSESHLHLQGVTSAEETWADNLLKPTTLRGFGGRTPEEHRLLVLDLFAGKILALAIWTAQVERLHSRKASEEYGLRPRRLLRLFDRIYFARSPHEEHLATHRLRDAIADAIYQPTTPEPVPEALELELVAAARARLGPLAGLEDSEGSIGGLQQEGDRLHERKILEELQRVLRLTISKHLPGAKSLEIEGALPFIVEAAIRRATRQVTRRRWRASALAETVYKSLPTRDRERLPRGTGCLLSDHRLDDDFRFLLRWISPTAYHQQVLWRSGKPPGNCPETLQDRYRLVCQLHLAAHLELIRATPSTWYQQARYGDDDKVKRKEANPPRHFLHRALFRYLVCRTHHWQLSTQQGRTTGLSHFRRYYASSQRRPKLHQMERSRLVFERLRKWRGLRVLEGRVAPPSSAHELVPWILAHARPGDHEKRRVQKFGLVVHFKKEREEKEDRPFSKHEYQPAPRLRWGYRRRHIRQEAMRLYRLLRRPTPVVPFIVGIDAANLELATPPEVFAPVFRFLRELPISTTGPARRFAPFFSLEPSICKLVEKRRLGMTYHVGEDFRHLLSGLRAICEVVDFLNPHPGDRLGHGTALALSPEVWLEHNGYQAVVPKLEWLDTLVWVHHFLGPGDEVVGELAIEDWIQRLSWEIYGHAAGDDFDPLHLDDLRTRRRAGDSPVDRTEYRRRRVSSEHRGLMDWNWSPLSLWDAWTLRQLDPYTINLRKLLRGKLTLRRLRHYDEEDRRWHEVQERIMRKLRHNIGSRNAMLLLGLYWLSPEVRERGQEILVVDMAENKHRWLELCRRVEDRLKERIHEHELVVEVNPSANRIIGPMERYSQHHVFELTLDEENRLKREVRVSVNTDNPAVCNTSLAHEHYLLGEVLMERGVPEAEVVKWLDWLRQNGNEYNFVRRLPTEDESPDMARLLNWLRNIRPSVREAQGRKAKYEAFDRWRRDSRLRGHGFDAKDIERSPELLDRLLELEKRLQQVRRSMQSDGAALHGEDAKLHEEVKRLDSMVEELRKKAGLT